MLFFFVATSSLSLPGGGVWGRLLILTTLFCYGLLADPEFCCSSFYQLLLQVQLTHQFGWVCCWWEEWGVEHGRLDLECQFGGGGSILVGCWELKVMV